MPRGTQFGEVITMFREETGQASSRAMGQNQLPADKALLRRHYRRLHRAFSWPHLNVFRDKEMLAGQRYYSYPLDLDFENIYRVEVRENGGEIWYPLHYGVDRVQLNAIHSDEDEREDFPITWEVHEDDQFEVWPIPETSGHTVRFHGRARAKTLVEESETLDIDDDLVVLYAAAERLRRDKSPDADLILEQARQHYMRLRAESAKDRSFSMSVNRDRRPQRAPIDIKYAEYRD